MAVGRFVAVGEAIAAENQELKDEMGQACFEARRAGGLRLVGSHYALDIFFELLHLNFNTLSSVFLLDEAGRLLFCCHKFKL